MKSKLLGTVLVLGAFVAVGSSMSAFGMVEGEITANVPFAFRVGKAILPAGKYLIISADDNNPNMLEIRNENGSPSVLVMTDPLSPPRMTPRKTKLLFAQVGKLEYLSQIWERANPYGSELIQPALEHVELPASASKPAPVHTTVVHRSVNKGRS